MISKSATIVRRVLLVAILLGCKSPPYAPDPHAQARLDLRLAGYETKQALSEFVGAPPALCIRGSATEELCEWQASNRLPGWQALAASIDTDDRVNLICSLPLSGAPRASDSCSVHPRRSNRYSWKVPAAAPSKGGGGQQESAAEVRRLHRELVDRWMSEADTLLRLSRLMGAIPNECRPGSPGTQICLWRTTSHTFGQGTLVVWIGAAKRKKIRLQCTVPTDGSARQPNSCFAEVGA
jgi:hypothetical protein